jgi:type IV pilus assembly protein PilC
MSGTNNKNNSQNVKPFFWEYLGLATIVKFILTIFEYALIGFKEIIIIIITIFRLSIVGFQFVILMPFTNLYNSASFGVDRALKRTQTVAKKEDSTQSVSSNSFWKKLNSNIGGEHQLSQAAITKLENQRHALQVELASPEAKRLTEAKVFVYKARTKSGRFIDGRFIGFSKLDVNAFLLNEGYDVYSIENNKWIDFLYGQSKFGSHKLSNKDLIFWLTQLSTYVKAGIPLTESVKILMNQMGSNKSKQGIFQAIAYQLTMGESFSSALEKQGEVFPPLLINMLKAAEATGELEETLDDMANYYTDIETTRKEMVSALMYPIIVTVFALGVISFILLYVLPQFSKIYESMDVQVTGLTLFLLNLSSFLQYYGSFILLGIFLLVIINMYLYRHVRVYRENVQIFNMKLPVFGNIIIYNEMTIFAKTFASLLKNNVDITQSIDILSRITNNEIYKKIMVKTINNITKGDKISEAFKNQWAVPDVAYYMIVTGESTGQLAEMMSRVSAYYQEQHHSLIANLKSLIEPILIVMLAVVVGGIILAVIIPMFNMYEQISVGS